MDDIFKRVYRWFGSRDTWDADSLADLAALINRLNQALQIDGAVRVDSDERVRDAVPRLVAQLSVAVSRVEATAGPAEAFRASCKSVVQGEGEPSLVVPPPLSPRAPRGPVAAKAAETPEPRCELERLEGELAAARDELRQRSAEQSDGDKKALELIQSMIYYRDRLFSQLEYAQGEGSALGEKLINGMLYSTRKMLTDNGVEVLDGAGAFDASLHQIIAVEPTDDPALDLHVASTQREGYRYGGGLIRYQEITVYQFKAKP